MNKKILFIAALLASSFYALVSNAQYGRVATVAGGSGWGAFAGDGGPATASTVSMGWPSGVSTDTAGDIFIYDVGNARIRKVHYATGIITTIAGNGTSGYSGDGGPGPVAEIAPSAESGLCADRSGNCYIVDGQRIRRIDYITGVISTVAGNGTSVFSGDGGPATSAGLNGPQSVCLDTAGNIYIACSNRIRKVMASTGIITTIGGNGVSGFSGDGGPATLAMLNAAYAVAVDMVGNVYISDANNYRIRKINTSGIITTVAGTGGLGPSGDGSMATAALLDNPEGIAVDATGNVYFNDHNSGAVREINVSTGIINTVAGNYFHAGSADYTSGRGADSISINAVYISVDGMGNIFYADGVGWVEKITGPVSGINTLSTTDSLATTVCTLPATVDFGIGGTINGTPLSTDSARISIDFGQFCSTPRAYTLPYWHTSTYGFGSLYSIMGSYTYKIPGRYTPVIRLTTIDGFTDETNAPAIQVGNNCSSSVTGISITSATDSFVSVPCSIPMNVRYIVNGTISGTPSAGDSAYIVYQYNTGDTTYDMHIVPYVLVGSTYRFTDTIIHPSAAGGYFPSVLAVNSSGNVNSTSSPMGFSVAACSGGTVGGGIEDSASSATYCSLPFSDAYNVAGLLSGYADTADSVRLYVNYGDGTDTSLTAPVYTDGHGSFSFGNYSGLGAPIFLYHTYTIAGPCSTSLLDTAAAFHGASVSTARLLGTSCSPVSGIFYIDANLDCIHETGEILLGYWPYALISNTIGDTTYGWCDDSGHYALELVNGDTYTLVANPFNYFSWYGGDSLHTSCPATGIYTVTAAGSVYTEDFAFSCSPPDAMDMTISGWGWGFVPGDTGIVGIWSSDYTGYICDSLYATVTLTLDPLLTYIGMWDGPAPTGVSGHTLTWVFGTVGDLFDFTGDVKVVTSTSATFGAPVCNTLYVSPSPLTDPDLTNNTYSWCEPVNSSWDPNEKQVSPLGTGTEGFIPNGTPLSYMIHFQNTGTAAARNITVSDTISANLDIATLQVINASSPVLVHQEPGNVVKFRFNNINLPDSLHDHLGSIGYIAYNIMPKPGLPPGTQIINDAAIYFDYNPAVVTNTTLNTIEYTGTTTIPAASNKASAEIYPNPATTVLTIKTTTGAYNSFTITNTIGQIMLDGQLDAPVTNVAINWLPAGIYYISLRGENGSMVRKFVKM